MGKTKTLIFKGYKPKPWQKVVHDSITKAGLRSEEIFIVKSPRQIGKSMIIEQELIRHALNFPFSVSICLSLTISNCRKIYKEIVSGCKRSGIIEKNNDSLLQIEFITGSSIIFLSAQQKETLRGYTVRGGGIFCIDEAAYIPDEIFDITAPYVSVNKASTLMVSTPRLKQGTFYNYFMMGLTHVSPKIHSFDLSLYDTSEFLSQEKKEIYKKVMPPNQYKTEILGEFIDNGGNLFNIDDSLWIGLGQGNKLIYKDGYESLYIGIDWSNGTNGDYTVVSGLDENGRQRVLHYDKTKGPNEQIEQITDLLTNQLDSKKIRRVYAESNSMGAVYIDILKDKLKNQPFEIESFTTTNSSKREIIESLSVELENKNLQLLNQKEQKAELMAYSMEITKSGLITYNAPYGLHDDMVIALALSNYGRIKENKTSNYSLSFGGGRGISNYRRHD